MKRIAFIICFLYSFCCFVFANKLFFNEILNKTAVCEANTIEFGSIIFNEIMANPKGISGLPESEYIELYNRTDNVISLKKCTLNYGGKKYLLPDITIDAKNYIVLCNQKYKDLWAAKGISVTGVSSFPALLNTGKLLWLEDEYGSLISWVEYTDSWYKDNKKKDGGYSLECIDPDNLSNDAANWCATNDLKGGTPGKANSLKKSLPDKAKIDVLSAFIQSSDTLVINFSKPMNVISLGRLDNYTSLNSAISFNKVIPDYPCGRNVKLILNSSLKAGEKVEIKLHNLIDVSGNTLTSPITFKLSIPEQIETGDVFFNEVLFNPRSGGVPYIELSNVSEKVLPFNQLFLSYQKEDGTRSEPISLNCTSESFIPHTEIFFTNKIDKVSSQYKCDISKGIQIANLPDLPNKEGKLFLISAKGDFLDEMTYSESMHTTSLTDRSGVALEKKSPELLSSEPSNWMSASFSSGYGTPGAPNKCTISNNDKTDAEFWLEKKSFSPESSESNKLQIRYLLSEERTVANIKIFEASGREVCSLGKNIELSAEGMIEWDGKQEDKSTCRVGLYIAYVEMHSLAGAIRKYKLPFAVVR